MIRIQKGERFYRARPVEEKGYGELGIGLYPTSNRLYGFDWKGSKELPKEKAKAGRLSYSNEPALYLATDEATVCSEVKPKIRQLISVATFVSEEELEIIDFSKLKYTRPLNTYDDKYSADIRSFHATGDNYTFFQENMKKFKWKSSRIVINYATANFFCLWTK